MSLGIRSGVNCRRANEPPTTAAEGAHRERLGDAGHALEEQVPAGQQPDEHPLDHGVLPDDDPLDLDQRLLERGGRLRHLVLTLLLRLRHAPKVGRHPAAGSPSPESQAALRSSDRRSRTHLVVMRLPLPGVLTVLLLSAAVTRRRSGDPSQCDLWP